MVHSLLYFKESDWHFQPSPEQHHLLFPALRVYRLRATGGCALATGCYSERRKNRNHSSSHNPNDECPVLAHRRKIQAAILRNQSRQIPSTESHGFSGFLSSFETLVICRCATTLLFETPCAWACRIPTLPEC